MTRATQEDRVAAFNRSKGVEFMDELSGAGERTGGPPALENANRKRFGDQLGRLLAKV